MSHAPLVSVITCFLNAERFLAEAIESVFAQTFEDWELLLIDDGSTDGSTAVAQRFARDFPDRIRFLEHLGRENRGLAASRNLGVTHAKAPLIAPLDSDDVWLPQKLERQMAILSEHPEITMVFGKPVYWHSWRGAPFQTQADVTPQPIAEPGVVYWPPHLFAKSLRGNGYNPCPSDLLIRRDTLVGIGGFEEAFAGNYAPFEDVAMLVKVFLSAPVFIADETWLRYRLHDESCCATQLRAGNQHSSRAFYLTWLLQYLQDHGVTDASLRRRICAMRFFSRHRRIAAFLRPARKAAAACRGILSGRSVGDT